MCGISGRWIIGRPEEALASIESMNDALAHRGPDASGSWVDEGSGLALGHRRLAIVGLGPTGAQPMRSRSGRWTITYNGELYGDQAVRGALQSRGLALRGTSDTELVVEALDAWGVERTLEQLDGMFAFGAWDAEERRLILARDRMGEKPLVYGRVAGGFAFASELGALRVLPGFDPTVDRESVALFLRFQYVPSPRTIHPGIAKLPAGHWLEVRAGDVDPRPKPYWSFAAEVERGAGDQLPDDPETLVELRRVLQQAVGSTLRSDVPLGAFLSGGIDSSLVVGLAAQELGDPVRTFTIASPDADHDESSHARAVADHVGADHTELLVTAEDALAEVPTLAGCWDEPFGDSSQLPTLLLARLTRESVTVSLSGDGGDELFGGYNRHVWLPKTWAAMDRVPSGARRVVGGLLGRPSPERWDRIAGLLPESRRPRMVGLKAQKMASLLAARDEGAAYAGLVSHWQDPSELVGVAEPWTPALHRSAWPRAATLAEEVMAIDALTYLPDDVLVKVDRASMSVGLEARVPLLARSVVELSTRLPLSMKIRDGDGKWALREVLAGLVPRPLWDRPKSGFGVPIAQWLNGPLRPWADDLLAPAALEATGLVDPAVVRAAWQEHRNGKRDRSYELWDVLMLESWARSQGVG